MFLEDEQVQRAECSPTPEEIVVKGRQLQKFVAAKLTMSNPATVITRASITTAFDMINSPPLRVFEARWRGAIDVELTWGNGSNAKYKKFTIPDIERDQQQILLPHLLRILERLPCDPSELGQKQSPWVKRMAKRLGKLFCFFEPGIGMIGTTVHTMQQYLWHSPETLIQQAGNFLR